MKRISQEEMSRKIAPYLYAEWLLLGSVFLLVFVLLLYWVLLETISPFEFIGYVTLLLIPYAALAIYLFRKKPLIPEGVSGALFHEDNYAVYEDLNTGLFFDFTVKPFNHRSRILELNQLLPTRGGAYLSARITVTWHPNQNDLKYFLDHVTLMDDYLTNSIMKELSLWSRERSREEIYHGTFTPGKHPGAVVESVALFNLSETDEQHVVMPVDHKARIISFIRNTKTVAEAEAMCLKLKEEFNSEFQVAFIDSYLNDWKNHIESEAFN